VITPYLHHSYARAVLEGLTQAARAADYDVVVCSPTAALRTPRSGLVRQIEELAEGVVVLHPYAYQLPSAGQRGRIPVVTIDHGGQLAAFPSVSVDSYGGACTAVRHLLALGHRRIAHLTGAEEFESARARRRAYEDTLAWAGILPDPRLIATGRYTERGGHDAATVVLRCRPRPTAIFAANDLSAIGALRAAEAAGARVPRDLSVIGFDDVAQAQQVSPQLTTIRQPLFEVGRVACERLLALMRREPLHRAETVLPTELVVRSSTASPPREVGPAASLAAW
jgi:LacI family transcriptional regulator